MTRVTDEVKKRKAVQSFRVSIIDASIAQLQVSASPMCFPRGSTSVSEATGRARVRRSGSNDTVAMSTTLNNHRNFRISPPSSFHPSGYRCSVVLSYDRGVRCEIKTLTHVYKSLVCSLLLAGGNHNALGGHKFIVVRNFLVPDTGAGDAEAGAASLRAAAQDAVRERRAVPLPFPGQHRGGYRSCGERGEGSHRQTR